MSVLQAVILGVIQGATEFLPVSSSGHLVVMKHLFGTAEVPLLFDVLLHVATLVAVVAVFRGRIGTLITVSGRFVIGRRREEDGPHLRLIVLLLVATVITAVMGLTIDRFESIRTPKLTSALFLVTAGLLVLTRLAHGTRRLEGIRWVDALAVGLAQGAGVFPGISRSGITIATGLYVGLDRTAAGEFSFLLAIPAIAGALVLTLADIGQLGASVPAVSMIAGFVAALLVGYFALVLLIRFVRNGQLYVFAAYLIPLGVWGLLTF